MNLSLFFQRGNLCFTYLIFICCLQISMYHCSSPQPLSIVSEHTSAYIILVPDDMDEPHRFAAAELADYIRRMTGVNLPIHPESVDSQYGIYIGATTTADEEGILDRAKGLRPDGFVIEQKGDNLYLCGSNTAGTLFAVYDLLEEWGVRWFAPQQIGEIVPEVSELAYRGGKHIEEPDIPMRMIGEEYDELTHSVDMVLKNRMQKRASFNLAERVEGTELQKNWRRRNKQNVNINMPDTKLGVNVYGWIHNMADFLYYEEILEDHPEYLAFVKVRTFSRYISNKAKFCYTNREVASLFAQRINAFLDAEPTWDVITLGPPDGLGNCQCPMCEAVDLVDVDSVLIGDQAWHVTRQNISRRYIIFHNWIGEEVEREHPDVNIKLSMYNDVIKPDSDPTLRLRSNLRAHFTQMSCYSHPMEGPHACPLSQRTRSYIEAWRQKTDHLDIYAYLDKYAMCELPWPLHELLRYNITFYNRTGVRLYFTQYTPRNAFAKIPLYYVAAKLIWDTDMDVDALIDDYFMKCYGSAADAVRNYHQVWQDAVNASPLHMYYIPGPILMTFIYTPEVLATAERHLKQAERDAADSAVTQRVSLLRHHFEYVKKLMAFAYHMVDLAKQHPDQELLTPEQLESINTMVMKIRSIFRKYKKEPIFIDLDKARFFNRLVVNLDDTFDKAQVLVRVCQNGLPQIPDDSASLPFKK